MRLPTSRQQCAMMEGDGGQKTEHAPPLRNPFVHLLRFTPLEKAKMTWMVCEIRSVISRGSFLGGGWGGELEIRQQLGSIGPTFSAS
ncbi:unnamed protein product [Boreogadus saida]